MAMLDDPLARLATLPEAEQKAFADEVVRATAHMHWMPNPGPQTDAYNTLADELLFGGQAGGGKSQLALGIGVNEAQTGIIFRRELSQTDGLERDGKLIVGDRAGWNGKDLEWTWADGRSLKLGGMRDADSWIDHAGRERDYMAFDEAGEFLETQVASISAWLRAPAGRRCRLVLASNPPRTSDGLWLIEWFAPWLDPQFARPATPGELRWCVMVRGKTVWVDGPGKFTIDGEDYLSKSRTFIPAALADNPYRDTPQYRAQLQSLPEPLRSQLLYGDFATSLSDHPQQVIPALWVRMAMNRWTERPPEGIPMSSIGLDASGGGKDPMVLAPRYDGYFCRLIEIPGKDIPMERPGQYAAGIVISHRRDNAGVVVDMGGGYGGPAFEQLKANHVEAIPYKGASAGVGRTRDKQLKFANCRSQAIWQFREALDPGQPGGSPIALPLDNVLLGDLTAPTYKITAQGIAVEPKLDVCKKLGRSTNKGDAVVMSYWHGPKGRADSVEWGDMRRRSRFGSRLPHVVTQRPKEANHWSGNVRVITRRP